MNEPTTQQQKPRRLPYGMQNWEDVRLHDYYYVDKTRFIPLIEEANHYFFFIRPRLHKLVLLWRGMELAVAEELHSQNNLCDAMTEPRLY